MKFNSLIFNLLFFPFFFNIIEIIWENIEVSSTTRQYMRIRTNLITMLLLIIGFAIVLQASIYKQVFEKEKPDLTLCDTEIPALYQGSYDSSEASIMEFTRVGSNMTDTVAYLDSQCNAEVTDTSDVFWGLYGDDADASEPSATYSIDVCAQDPSSLTTTGMCPHAGQTTFCPCLSLTLNQTCETLICDTDPSSSVCQEFSSTSIADCFCMASLTSIITDSQGFSDLISRLEDALTVDPCKDFYSKFLSAIGLSYGSQLP